MARKKVRIAALYHPPPDFATIKPALGSMLPSVVNGPRKLLALGVEDLQSGHEALSSCSNFPNASA
jgi:hypothetical protein